MSEEEEEVGIAIKDGPRRELFSVEEANDAEHVQNRFALDSKPQNVLNHINNKPVKFGKLKDDKIYTLPKSQVLIPNQKIHRQNAVVLSKAIYKEHPIDMLKDQSTSHTIGKVCDITEYSPQKVILAVGVVDNTNVLYVAYRGTDSRGTDSRGDFMADINIRLKEKDNMPGAKFHAGFEERSNTVPVEYILMCAEKEDCQTIVTCGHSLGGAVSSIIALDLMKNTSKQVYNITFGAPFFGNETARKACGAFKKLIVHYVDCKDIVPGLLSLEHTTSILMKEKIQVQGGVFQSLIDLVLQYQTMTARLAKFLLENVPAVQIQFTDEEVRVLTKLASDIMKGFKETGLGEKYTDEMFVPIGNYILLENGSTSVLDTDNVSPQLQELVLKEPIKKVKSLHAITEGHSIASYFNTLNSDIKNNGGFTTRQDIVQDSFFKPDVQGKVSVLWMTNDDGGKICQLAARGRFLKSLQMNSPINKFSRLPFNSTSKFVNVPDGENEALFLYEETAEMMEIDQVQTCSLKLATPFGILTLLVSEVRESSLGQELKNISVEEPVATILYKSVSRLLAISGLATGEKRPDNDGLKNLIEIEISRLDPKCRQTYYELYASKSPLSQKDKISKVTEKIIESITEKMEFFYKKMELRKYKENIANKETLQSGKVQLKGFWANIGMFLSWLLGRGQQVEADYVKQLRAVIQEIRISGIINTDAEKDDLLSEMIKRGENTEDNQMSAYLLERLLMSYEKSRDHMKTIEVACSQIWTDILMYFLGAGFDEPKMIEEFLNKEHTDCDVFLTEVDNLINSLSKVDNIVSSFHQKQFGEKGQYTSEVKEMLMSAPVLSKMRSEFSNWTLTETWISEEKFPRKSEEIFSHLTENSKKDVENKISIFRNVQKIRKLYGKQCYIGFVGPQNAGKSTLLNALFHKTAETGMRTHTREPTKYQVAEDIFAIDFPGSDSLSDQMCESLESSGHMNNLQVYVMQYNGSPNQQLIANVKLAYRLKKLSGKSSKTLFCLNKASLFSKTGTSFNDVYRKEYVQMIRHHIETHHYDEKEESLWRKLKEGAKEQFGSKAYEAIAQLNEELKQYTLSEIQDDDFIFTDWEDKNASQKGIKGIEEVRKRIKDFLVASNIRTLDNTMDI